MRDRVAPARSSSDLPAMEIRVASPLASFGAALRKVSSFPVPRLPAALANAFSGLPQVLHLPASPAMEIQVALFLASFSVAGAQPPGYPESCASSPAVSMRLRVTPNPASSGRADGEFLGCPAFSAPQPRQLVVPRVTPVPAPSGVSVSAFPVATGSCLNGRVDDDSPTVTRTLHPRPKPRMNLRVQSDLAHSCQTLGVPSTSPGPSPRHFRLGAAQLD